MVDLWGCRHREPPVKETQLFCFDINFCRKATVLGVDAPQRGRRPQWEILDSGLNLICIFNLTCFAEFSQHGDYDARTGCPKGLLIPPYGPQVQPSTTPPPPVTGRPGDPGPQGPAVSINFMSTPLRCMNLHGHICM